MPYVESITDVLSSHLGFHRARLKFMARFTSAVLAMTTTNLRCIAIALKAGVEAKSNYRRTFSVFSPSTTSTQRRSGVFFCTCFRRRLLTKSPLTAQSGILAPSRSMFWWSVLPMREWPFPSPGAPFRGRAAPAPKRRPAARVERFLEVVDPEDVEVVIASGREFISVEWLRHLREQNVPFCVRIRSDRRVGRSPEAAQTLPARMHARTQAQVGDEPRVLSGERYLFGSGEAGQVLRALPARVVVRRIGADGSSGDQFLILAAFGIDPEEATKLYRRRWEILALFAALKSRGFDLEETHLTAPERVERLIGLLTLAFAWTRLVGQKRAARHGPPPTKKSHGRRERSLFRYGLDWLQSILTTPEPQHRAFYTCLRGLRSPTAFLSCT